MENTLSQLCTGLCTYLKTSVPELVWVDQNFGQLENFEYNAATAFPAALVDLNETQYTSTTGLSQTADLNVQVKIYCAPFNGVQSPPTNLQEKAAQYYDLEEKIVDALQGWATAEVRPLLRASATTEGGAGALRVRVLNFNTCYEDEFAPVYQKIPVTGAIEI